jgi:hypothetical protein
VVVDEGHAYRGAFGCHTALVLRRLRRVCARAHGSGPLFVMTSATVANPRHHARLLLGLAEGEELAVAEEDGSPAGTKLFMLWNAPLTADAKVMGAVKRGGRMCTDQTCSPGHSDSSHLTQLSKTAGGAGGGRGGPHAHRGARDGALHLPRAAAADARRTAGRQRGAQVRVIADQQKLKQCHPNQSLNTLLALQPPAPSSHQGAACLWCAA